MKCLFNLSKNKFKPFTKMLSAFLAFLMVFSSGIISCYAMGAGVPEKIELENALSDYIEEIVDLDDVKSIDEENTSDNELYFNMEDDSTTVYSFSEPVTYVDENGQLKCKDNSIIEQKNKEKKKAGYDYSNGQNDYRIHFSSDSSKGLLVEYNDISFSFSPISEISAPGYVSNSDLNNERFENFEYADLYGENTALKYFPQINGVKEIITLGNKVDINIFKSLLKTNGCTPVINEDGSVSLISSETEEEVQNFTAPFAFDNAYVEGIDDHHYCSDCYYELEKIADDTYILSVTVSDEWLNSEETVYPVTIDPTTSNISNYFDAGVYSAVASNNYGNEQTCCFGRASEYGYGRVYSYFQLPSAIAKYATINSAYIWERETTGRTTTTYVTPYLVTDSWSETKITWSNKSAYDSATAMTKRNINSKSTDDSTNPYWYKFNIKTAVTKWVNGTANRGIVFISNEESNKAYNWRAFTSKTYSSSAMRPYTVINYTNDTTAPTAPTVSGNPTAWKNSNITLTAKSTDAASGVSHYSFSTTKGSYSWQTAATKAVSANTTYYVYAKDKAGNISAPTTVAVSKIDKTKPTAPTVSGNPTSWKNSNITLTAKSTDAASGVSHYSFSTTKGSYSWQTAATKTVSANTTYYVYSKDAAGNISDPTTVTVSKIDKTKPTAPTVTGNPTSWVKDKATLTASSTDTGSGVAYYSFSTKEKEYSWQTSASKPITANGTYYVYSKDAAGNISDPTTVTVSKVENTTPAAPTVTGNPANWTNQNATLTASSTDSQSGIKYYSFSTTKGSYTWQTAATKTVTANGTYYVYSQDAVGHSSAATTVVVSKIDKVKPTAPTVTQSPTEWTNGNVTLTAKSTDALSGVAYYSFSTTKGSYTWQTAATKTVTANGTYYVYAKDKAGNISDPTTVTVSNIDKVKPTAPTVTKNPTDWTNGDVTLTAKSTDALSGVAYYSFSTAKGEYSWQTSPTYKVTENGIYYVYAQDKAGNISDPTTVTVSNIDKVKPTAPTVTQNTTLWTKEDIILTAKSTDALSGVAYYSFSTAKGSYSWQTAATKTVTANNTTYYVYAKDKAGNISDPTTVTVGNIDKTAPATPTVTGNPTSWVKDKATLTASSTDSQSGVKYYSFSTKENEYSWQTEPDKSITENGTYYVYAEDAAGNSSKSAVVEVNKIDNVIPTVDNISQSPSGWTNGNVTLTVTASDSQSGVVAYSFSTTKDSYSWQTGKTKTVTSNGTYYVYVKDAVGHISAPKTINIKNIDKTKPTAPTVTQSPTVWTNGDVTLTASSTDTGSGVAYYSFSTAKGEYSWQTSPTYKVTENGTYYVYAQDKAGNTSFVSTYVVDNIDRVPPAILDVTCFKEYYDLSVTVSAEDDASEIYQYSFNNGITWQSENVGKVNCYLDEFTVAVKDKAGNITKQTISASFPEFYENGTFIGLQNLKTDDKMQYKIGEDGEWVDYIAPFAVPAFSTVPVYARFADSSDVYCKQITSNSNNYGVYTESNVDFSLNCKNISFDFIRSYNSFNRGWSYSVNCMVMNPQEGVYEANLPDGRRLAFVKQDDTTFVSELTDCVMTAADDSYIEVTDGDITYVYTYYLLSAVKNNKYGDTITITRDLDNIYVSDETGRSYVLGFDDYGKISTITDPEGGVITYSYNYNDNITAVIDQSGVAISKYTYDGYSIIKSMDKSIKYDENGRVSFVEYDSGAYTKYTYDDENLSISTNNSLKEKTSETYNDAFFVVSSTDEEGSTTEYTYDEYARIASETTDGKTISYTYDENGNVLSEISDDTETDNSYYVYDESNHLIRQQTGSDYTYYAYNENGEVVLSATLKEDYTGSIPPVYDEGLTCFDTTKYTYDNGLLVKSVSGDETAAYEYDKYGNTIKTAVSTTQNGETTVSGTISTYDLLGNVLTSKSGDDTSSYIYDAAGRTLLANENGKCTRTLYDNLGRVVQEISPEDYDASKDGLPAENTYADSKAGHTYSYADNGTLASETNRLGKTTTYSYNDVGNKIHESFDLYDFYYTEDGNLYEVEISGQSVVRYEYEDANLVTQIYANDDVIRFEYNNNGDVIAQYHNSNAKPYVTYTYADGELTEKVNKDTGLKYVYGENGQVSIYKISDNTLVQYYAEEETEADEEAGTEGFKTVTENHFGKSYSSVVKDKSVSYTSNGSTVEYSYQTSGENEDEKVTSDTVKNGAETAISSAYAYDEDGNITKKAVTLNGETADFINSYDTKGKITSATAFGNTVSYTYDKDDQLVASDRDHYSASYSYDDRGNIISKTVNDETMSFTYADSGWLDQLVEVDGVELTYDANGNVLTYGDREYTWNTGRNLESIIDEDNECYYTYDENGIRTSKTVNDVTTYYNTLNGVILSQTDGTNTMYFQYDTNGTPLGFIYNGTQYFYITNQTNDVVGITDANGNKIAEYTYDDWGKLLSITTADAEGSSAYLSVAESNPLRYRGYYYDNETGYYYLQSRYYDANICRFINADKLEFLEILIYSPIDINMFAYSKNDSVNNVDYNGGCYYSVNLKWCHDNWEYRGGYKRKSAPGISKYLFPSYYQIPIKNGGSIHFKDYNSVKLKDMPAETDTVYFLTPKQAAAAIAALSMKGVISLIKKLITEYKKANKKGITYTKEKLRDLIVKEIAKKFGEAAAKDLTQFVAICSVDISFITDEILVYSQLKTMKNYKKYGLILYRATYTKNNAVTLIGTSYLSIKKWGKYVVKNPTNSNYYLKKY